MQEKVVPKSVYTFDWKKDDQQYIFMELHECLLYSCMSYSWSPAFESGCSRLPVGDFMSEKFLKK